MLYLIILQSWSSLLLKKGNQLWSAAVMADFKLALIQAMELQFPSTRIMGCYFHFAIKANSPNTPGISDYVDYFESWTFIILSYSFPPKMWNHFQNSGPGTNNHLQGWHYHLNRLARKSESSWHHRQAGYLWWRKCNLLWDLLLSQGPMTLITWLSRVNM